MSLRSRTIARAALALTLMVAVAGPLARAATPATFLIVNPAGRGNAALAEGFLADFAKALQASWPKDAPWPSLAGRYHVSSADAVASIHREAPLVALVSPGFYLEQRARLDLRVLAAPVRREGEPVARILAREGASPSSHPRIGGQLAGEPGWLWGAVMGQDPPWLAGPPVLVPVAKTLEAVRMAESGQLDFVVLADSDWRMLERTNKAAGLRVVATSAPLPEGPVVCLGEPSAAARAAATAMMGFQETPEGRDILARMGLSAFASAGAAAYEPFAEPVARAARDRAAASVPGKPSPPPAATGPAGSRP